jgi:hypothetical protein
MFLEDNTKMRDNLVNVILSGFMMISVGIDENNLTTWCNPHLKYYPSIESITTKTSMDMITENTKYSTIKAKTVNYRDGTWVYTRCAVNLDGKSAYNLIDNSKMLSPVVTDKSSLGMAYYYDTTQVDLPYNYFYGEYQYLRIKNAGSLLTSSYKTAFFIRGLTVFSEFIPKISQLQYFDFTSLTSNSNFPGLYITMNPEWSATSKVLSGYYFNAVGNRISINFNTSFKTNYSKYTALESGFFRLNLATPNTYWSDSELIPDATKILTCTANSYCYMNLKQINCPSNQYYDMSINTCKVKCPENTLPSYGSFYSTGNVKTGFCTKPCGILNGPACAIIPSNFLTSFSCYTGFTRSHMMCVDNSLLSSGALHYSGFFGAPAKINIPVPSTTNYFVDFWFFTDIVFNQQPQDSSTNYYIWYTDAIGLIRKNNDKSSYQIIGPNGTLYSTTFTLEYGQWYKIAYNVKNNEVTLIYNRKTASNKTFTYSSNLTLTNIYFCHNTTCGPVGGTIKWASGYYRNIRVWSGDYMNLALYKNLDQYWTFLDSPTVRFTALKIFYPLNIKYLSEKKLRDPETTPIGDVSPSGSYLDPYQLLNYSSNFDHSAAKSYISSFTFSNGFYKPNYTECPSNCEICNALECITCHATHYLKAGECINKASEYKYLISPGYLSETSTPVDISFKAVTGVTSSFTVSFFVKMLGWGTTMSSFDIFRYGSEMQLTYDISKDELYLTDGNTKFATVKNFLSLFGTWINISFSYFYDSTKNSSFPAMMNFQVNFENKNISGNFNNKEMNGIVIPKESIGIYAKIWVSSVYMTGPWGEISNKNTTFKFTKFIDGGTTNTNCVLVSDLIVQVDIECGLDYDELLDESTNWCTNYSFVNKSTPYCKSTIPACTHGYYTSDLLCSCPSDPSVIDAFPTYNSGDYKCKTHDYVDFGQIKTTTISAIGVSGKDYTIEFWLYLNNYVTGSFTDGFEIKWNKHMMIKLKYVNSNYVSICYPLYDSSDSSKENSNSDTMQISHRAWVYVRCSVSNTLKKYLHFKEDNVVSQLTLNGTAPTVGTDTTLIFSNNSINNGLIYFKQLRLWKCYLCQYPDTYKLDITSATVGNYLDLLHLWDPTYSSGTYPPLVTDTKANRNFTPVVDVSWKGYNIFDMSGYKVLSSSNDLCAENAHSCTGLIRLNEINDVSISSLPSTTGRYTIELWVMVTSLSNLNNGFHVIWRNLVSLSFSKSSSDASNFNSYCWPLDYQGNNESLKGNTSIENQAKTQVNDKFAKINYTNGSWFSVRCAVSYNNNQFYINTNTVQDIPSNLMWKNQRTDNPFRYMWQNGEKTNLIITGANLNTSTNIYIRQIMLYNDYLPQLLTFQNHDMSRLSSETMRSQIFSISFFNYWKQLNAVYYIDDATDLIYYPKVYQSGSSLGYTKNLSVQVHCEPSKNQKLVNGSCSNISACVTASLNVLYCQDENTPLICAENYHWDETKFKTSAATACTQACIIPYIRSPDSSKKGAFCNFKCDTNAVCPTSAADQVDLPNKYSCNNGYNKIGYKCVDSVTSSKSQLYFNGCLNFPNISFDFNSGFDTKFEQGHIIKFWMKIDRFNEFCTKNKRKYYFILEPHSIYLDTTNNNFAQSGQTNSSGFYNIVYENINSTALKGTLYSINTNTWNVVTIQVNLLNHSLAVYINNNLSTPDIKIDNIPNTIKLIPTKLVFCSTQGQSSGNSLCSTSSYASNLSWGAAFYKDIKIWVGANTNPWLIQQIENKLLSETLNSYLYYFPMNVGNSLNNSILNTLSTGGNMNYLNRYPNLTSDKEYVLNYSSKFEYSDLNSGQYMTSLELNGGAYLSSSCPLKCTRCTSNSPQACLECAEGYKLFSNMCKKITGYYVKIPISTSKTFLNLKNEDNDFNLSKENNITWTIWIKYFSHISSSPNCITIIRLKEDGSRYICYNPSTRILYFYDGVNILYQDTTFYSFIGQWVLLSFSSFLNNPPIIPNLKDYFSYQYAFYVQDQEVSKLSTYSVPAPGINFDVFDIGYDFSGLVADFRLYRNFIVNPFGMIFNSRKNLNLISNLPLSTEKSTEACINDQSLNISSYKTSIKITAPNTSYTQQLGISCVNDYLPYVIEVCPNNNSFFDYTKLNTMESPCNKCSSNCSGSCGSSDSISCTCDFDEAKDWLKVDDATKKLTCETPTYVDYSRGSMNVNGIKVAKHGEYSIEFWFYIYSYNNSTIAFDSHEVIWDLHNYIKIYKNDKNGISVRCSPVYDNRYRTNYIGTDVNSFFGPSDYGYDDFYVSSTTNSSDGLSIGSYYKWVYVQCSSSVPKKIYQVNQKVPTTINYKDENIPNLKVYNTTSLILQPGYKAKANYGFLFLKEIKLWSQYDIRHFSTTCNPGVNTLQYYDYNLLHYFKNNNTGTIMADILNSNVNGLLVKRSDFIGFNLINLVTKNSTIFPSLEECYEMNISPTSGFANSTTFFIKSREVQQGLKSTFRFYYRVKDTNDEIQIGDVSSVSETIYKFNIASELFGTQIGVPSNNTVIIEVYCDIKFPSERKTTLYKSLILYKENKFNSVNSDLTYDKLLSSINLNNQTKNTDIFIAVELLKVLQTDMVNAYTEDPPITDKINITSPIIDLNSTQKIYIPAKLNLYTTSCSTNSNYCNNRGVCYDVGNIPLCKCLNDYSGQYCQLSKNNSAAWFKISNTLVDMLTSNSSALEINKNLVNSIDTLFKSINSLIDVGDTKEVKRLINIMNTLANSTSAISKDVIKNSTDNFVNIAKTMFRTNMMNFNQQKYITINDMLLKNNNASDFKNIDLKVEYVNLTNLGSINQSQKIFLDKLDPKLLSQPNMTYVLHFNDSSADKLLSDEQKNFNDVTIVNVKNYIQSILLSAFNSTSFYEPYEYKSTNDKIRIMGRKISDINKFDFEKYFNSLNHTNNYHAFFDAGDCLREFAQNLTLNQNLYELSSIFMMYIESKIPERNIKLQNNGNFISSSHTIKFFDGNLKEIKLYCNKGIIHYLPLEIYQQNYLVQEWMSDLTAFPGKYTAENYQKLNFVAPYYIYPNGTIDHSSTSDQLKKHYKNFSIRVVYYNEKIRNYDHNGIFFSHVTSDGYIVSKSNHLNSEFTSTLYFEPVKPNYQNHYFMRFPSIYKSWENIIGNMCFYTVGISFSLHFFILLIISVLKLLLFLLKRENITVKFINEYYESVEEINKDNYIFGEYRYEPPSDVVYQQTETKHINNSEKINIIASSDIEKEDRGAICDIEINKMPIGNKNDKGESISNSSEKQNMGYVRQNTDSVKLMLKDKEEDIEKMNYYGIRPTESGEELCEQNNKDDAKVEMNKIESGTRKFYNIFFFIFHRSIYGNAFRSYSPFAPNYKAFSKLVLLVYSLMFIVCVFCTFFEMDLTVKIFLIIFFRIMTILI